MQTRSKDGRQAECKACKHERKAMKVGDQTKVVRIRQGRVEEYLRGPNHGDSKTRLYRKWKSMHSRCYNSRARQWKWYGGRGITVCQEWHDWLTFKSWAVASGYQEGLELDRVDSDKNYEPDNCRWLTKRENIKRARAALSPEVNVQLHAEALSLCITPEDLIADIVTRHYSAADEALAPSVSRNTSSVSGGEEVIRYAI